MKNLYFQTHTTTYVTVTSPPTLVRLWVNRLCDQVFYFIYLLQFFRAYAVLHSTTVSSLLSVTVVHFVFNSSSQICSVTHFYLKDLICSHCFYSVCILILLFIVHSDRFNKNKDERKIADAQHFDPVCIFSIYAPHLLELYQIAMYSALSVKRQEKS